MPLYEHVFIARQDISPAQMEGLTETLSESVTSNGGKIAKTEYWGLRNLQYKIRKNRKGHYGLLNIDAPAEAIHELERQERINEDIIRILTIRVEEHDSEQSPIMSRGGGRDRGGRGDRGDRGDRGGNRGDR
ncbi:MAG: 30S ribosomal protein S6, partial [Pseudomonadota bacterium]